MGSVGYRSRRPACGCATRRDGYLGVAGLTRGRVLRAPGLSLFAPPANRLVGGKSTQRQHHRVREHHVDRHTQGTTPPLPDHRWSVPRTHAAKGGTGWEGRALRPKCTCQETHRVHAWRGTPPARRSPESEATAGARGRRFRVEAGGPEGDAVPLARCRGGAVEGFGEARGPRSPDASPPAGLLAQGLGYVCD